MATKPGDTGWEPGKGATGQAFKDNEHRRVWDAACSDPSYGLTLAQQRRYKDLKFISAMPIRNASKRPIGVLTVTSTKTHNKQAFTDGSNAYKVQLALAGAIGRLLIDLLELDNDDPNPKQPTP